MLVQVAENLAEFASDLLLKMTIISENVAQQKQPNSHLVVSGSEVIFWLGLSRVRWHMYAV